MNPVSKNYINIASLAAVLFISPICKVRAGESHTGLAMLRDSALAAISGNDPDQAALIVAENVVVNFTDGDKYYIFSPQEKILSDYLRFRFNTILSDCRAGISESAGYINKSDDNAHNYYLEASDSLDFAMMDAANARSGRIFEEIEKSAALSDEEKQFLKLKFDYTASFGKFCSIDAEDLTLRGREFASSAQDSLLSDYTADMLWTPKRAHLNAASNLFAGAFIPAGNLADVLGAGLSAGLSIDFGYDRMRLLADFGFLSGINVKENINKNDTLWQKGDKSNGNYVNFTAGFNVSPWTSLYIIPLLGVHSSTLRNGNNSAINQRDTPENISSGFRPMVGLAVDYTIELPYCDGEILGDTERRMAFIRFKTTYVPNEYGSKNSVIGGDVFFTGLGIGLYTDQRK